jgi:hypothetical protein
MDSTWAPIATRLAALPAQFDLDAALAIVTAGQSASIERLRVTGAATLALLTQDQQAKIPAPVFAYLDAGCHGRLDAFNPFASKRC